MKIPVVDLNRIFLLHYRSEDFFTKIDKGYSYITKLLANLTLNCEQNLKMVTLRTLCNLFKQTASTRSFFALMETVIT